MKKDNVKSILQNIQPSTHVRIDNVQCLGKMVKLVRVTEYLSLGGTNVEGWLKVHLSILLDQILLLDLKPNTVIRLKLFFSEYFFALLENQGLGLRN